MLIWQSLKSGNISGLSDIKSWGHNDCAEPAYLLIGKNSLVLVSTTTEDFCAWLMWSMLSWIGNGRLATWFICASNFSFRFFSCEARRKTWRDQVTPTAGVVEEIERLANHLSGHFSSHFSVLFIRSAFSKVHGLIRSSCVSMIIAHSSTSTGQAPLRMERGSLSRPDAHGSCIPGSPARHTMLVLV